MQANVKRSFWRKNIRLVAVVVLLVGTSSCILRLTGGFVFTDDISTFVRLAFDDVSVALCRDVTDSEGITTNECTYRIQTEDGQTQTTSTARLLSEFGLFGLLIDPVIVQVPQGSQVSLATADDGGGAQALRITEVSAFEAQPGLSVAAESGQVFWIIELPAAIEANLSATPIDVDYAFEYSVPNPPRPDNTIPIKVMYSARVEIDGDTYYAPLFPCVTDFSQVPEIAIPVTSNLAGLIFGLLFQFQGTNLGCANQAYDFPTSLIFRDSFETLQ